VEDTDVTFDEIRSKGYSSDVIRALDCLTRREGESYDGFIHRIMGNKLATRVKVADIKDNMDVTRLVSVTEKDAKRLEKYIKALKQLKSKL
jgi:phage terminase large subunit-like protein